MSQHNVTADILFHAAMAVGAGRTNSVAGAIMDAVKYLCPHDHWMARSEAFRLYKDLYDHRGDAWPLIRGTRGGAWITPEHKQELLITIIFTYEYIVQEMGAARSPADLGYS